MKTDAHPATGSVRASTNSARIELRDLASRYDAFIVDVWGVLCDGRRSFPAAVATLGKLHDKGPVALLSNTARRAVVLSSMLSKLGISRESYDVAITAGEICHAVLRSGSWAQLTKTRSRRLFYIGPERDRGILEATDTHDCRAVEEASAILCTGLLDRRPTVGSHRPLLERGVSSGLPLICANPDKHVWIGRSLVPCAGSLAELYEAMGGRVIRFGKPERVAYDVCLAGLGKLKSGISAERVLTIGDGLETDIAGAAAHGFASLLVGTGLTKEADLSISGTASQWQPTYTLPDLSW
ncbi:MAG: TIGR01459 family HAD-type hydrolase [Geminicoccaceae bacterium]